MSIPEKDTTPMKCCRCQLVDEGDGVFVHDSLLNRAFCIECFKAEAEQIDAETARMVN